MSLRDTLLQLGYVLIALGAVFATWALLTGPLARFTDRDRAAPHPEGGATRHPGHAQEDDPKNGST